MKLRCISFTVRGAELCRRIVKKMADAGKDCRGYAMPSDAGDDLTPRSGPLSVWTQEAFREADGIIFVGACGIAVRAVAPFVKDKYIDPAVLAVDEFGKFVVPLLSGHVGGANALAVRLAALLDAVPVISTSTDLNGCFAADCFAEENGLCLENRELAKRVSAALLRGEKVFLKNDFPERFRPGAFSGLTEGETGELGISISVGTKSPFANTLFLVPRLISLGIGCKKGTPEELIEQAVREAFRRAELSFSAIGRVRSIDLKAQEAGLLEFCKRFGFSCQTYSSDELSRASGSFHSSDFVKRKTGVDNVCERAAVMGGGRLILEKQIYPSVTVAAALEEKREEK